MHDPCAVFNFQTFLDAEPFCHPRHAHFCVAASENGVSVPRSPDSPPPRVARDLWRTPARVRGVTESVKGGAKGRGEVFDHRPALYFAT